MKKTVTVNLNGRVFTMDDDAYRLLDTYLENIRIYFRKEEGSKEIIADFEARIEELFSERIRLGYEVITIGQVEEVIARVGKPSDFGYGDPENSNREEDPHTDENPSSRQSARQTKRTFFRDSDGGMLGGICAGLAAYFQWDVLAVRGVAIVLMFASSFVLVPVYLLAWAIFPAAKTAAEKLQMQGKPITVENIGKTVAAETERASKNKAREYMERVLDAVVILMKICLVGIGCLIGLPLVFALVVLIIALFAVLSGAGGIDLLSAIPFFSITVHPLLATVSFILVAGVPLAVVVYIVVARIAKLAPVSRSVKWIILTVWILAVILFFTSGIRINENYGFFGWQPPAATDNIPDKDRYAEQEYVIDRQFTCIDIDDDLICNTRIEQTEDGLSTIRIGGSGRLTKQVRYRVEDGCLRLSSADRKSRFAGSLLAGDAERVEICINTPGVREIKSGSVGNTLIAGVFKADRLKLDLEGAGKFRADSLHIRLLETDFDGAGEAILGGTARRAAFELEGAGSINALELVADTVYAKVEGVGAVKCNPVTYLNAKVTGIGSLTYKDEPKEKHTEKSGIGRIGKE